MKKPILLFLLLLSSSSAFSQFESEPTREKRLEAFFAYQGFDLNDTTFSVGDIYIPELIRFEYCKFEIHPVSTSFMDSLVNFMKRNNKPVFELGAHLDDGTIWKREFKKKGKTYTATYYLKHQMNVMKKRAENIKKYLVEHGIKSKRLKVKEYGLTQPLPIEVTGNDPYLNRRIELKIVKVE